MRIRSLLKQINKDIKEYLNIHSTGKLTPIVTDPIHLKHELLKINKQLPTRLSLPEDPHERYLRLLQISNCHSSNPQ